MENMLRLKTPLLALVLLACCSPGWSGEVGRVVGVMDGDTVRVLFAPATEIKCRLFGIDAPEKSQAFGQRSKDALASLVFGRQAAVEILDTDRYGRKICKLFVGAVDVNREQVASGMAWVYRQYTNDAAYIAAEDRARRRQVGLWQDHSAIPPWEFRRQR
jgi:endonuclease YncB( thermonuclease family)